MSRRNQSHTQRENRKTKISRAAAAMLENLESRRLLATVTVTGIGDTIADDGTVTLREAITAINNGTDSGGVVADVSGGAYGTGDAIHFAIADVGIQVISPTTALPDIVKTVEIDATTQPGFTGTPLIRIDGAVAPDTAGIVFKGSGASDGALRGVQVTNWGNAGVFVDVAKRIKIAGCYLGNNGATAMPNEWGAIFGGGASDAMIGGTTSADRNVISGNRDDGLDFNDNTGNTIQGNYIGINAAGTAAIPNLTAGISFEGASGTNLVGGTGAGARNIISGNAQMGVWIEPSTGGITVQGNYIGTNPAGTSGAGFGNGLWGVLITDSPGNLIGGTSVAARNVISGNGDRGVQIANAGSIGNRIQGNHIGVNATGDAALGNADIGVLVSDAATANFVGGSVAGAGNVISGNGGNGVVIDDASSSGNFIQGNYIGTNAAGTAELHNGKFGVQIRGPRTLVGGTEAGARNVISGNTDDGIFLGNESSTSGVDAGGAVIQGNIIGLNAAGTAAVPNKGDGIGASYDGGPSTIGGTVLAARNFISGNIGAGAAIGRSAALLQGNYIGTDITGTIARPNGDGGIRGNGRLTVGGAIAGAGNLVSGNTGDGVLLNSSNDIAQGNRIGVSATGTALPNTGAGVRVIAAIDVIVGGSTDAHGNIIAYNGGAGVVVVGASNTGITIRHNSIFSNVGLGIDLEDNGVTGNDPLDGDTGANNRQNFPFLVSASAAAGITIQGSINSNPNRILIIDFYCNDALDPNGHDQGKKHIGSTIVMTDAFGNATFNPTFSGAVTSDKYITATATRGDTAPAGDTSEFSSPVQLKPALPPVAYGYNDLKTAKLKGGKYAFTGTAASFISGTFTSALNFSATINWGDGKSSAGQIVWNNTTKRFDVVGTHQYDKKGTYSMLITILDANGKTATASSKMKAS